MSKNNNSTNHIQLGLNNTVILTDEDGTKIVLERNEYLLSVKNFLKGQGLYEEYLNYLSDAISKKYINK